MVAMAGLEETLSGEGPFTIFAPTNEAFAKVRDPCQILPDIDHSHQVPLDIVKALITDTELLKQVTPVPFDTFKNIIQIMSFLLTYRVNQISCSFLGT